MECFIKVHLDVIGNQSELTHVDLATSGNALIVILAWQTQSVILDATSAAGGATGFTASHTLVLSVLIIVVNVSDLIVLIVMNHKWNVCGVHSAVHHSIIIVIIPRIIPSDLGRGGVIIVNVSTDSKHLWSGRIGVNRPCG